MWDFDAFEATVGIKGWIREGWGEWDLLRWGVWFLLYIWVLGDLGWEYRELLVWWELWEVGDRLRVMRGGWLLNTQVQRRELLLVGWDLWEVGELVHSWGEVWLRVMRGGWVRSETWGRAQRREERWDRGEETKWKKKLISSQKKDGLFMKKVD